MFIHRTQIGDRVSDIIVALGDYIRSNGLHIGDKMPSELQLAEKYGVSRSVVREAFRSLAALQLIELNPGKRASISAPNGLPVAQMIEHSVHLDAIAIQDIYDVRRTIEARTAHLAALRRSQSEADTIMFHAKQMKQSFDDPDLGLEHDLAFHHAIASASRNKMFDMLLTAFEGVIRETWPIGWKSRTSDSDRMEMVDLHIEIAQAIVEQDPIRASALMSQHFDLSTHALTRAGIR